MADISFLSLPKNLKRKYSLGDPVEASGVYLCSICEKHTAFRRKEEFVKCQDCAIRKIKKKNEWLSTNELTHFISKNINNEYDRIMSIQFRIAEKITGFAGNVWFATIHFVWFSGWILANTGAFGPQFMFDPFPFGLLTMIVSLEAIFLSTFIMISQNMSNKKSELRSDHEYQVNLNTEKQVAEVHAMLNKLLQKQRKK